MGGDHRIRPAHLADAPTLARLYRDAYATAADRGFPTHAATATRADPAAWIRDARVYVAVRDGVLVGSVRYRAAGKLVAHVERVARREGADRMRLRTFDGHPFLPATYRRRGYREMRVRPLEGAPFDVLHMEKEL